MKHTLASLAFALAAGIALGDTVTTTDGRRLEGKVKDLGNEILLEGDGSWIGKPRSKIEYGQPAANSTRRSETCRTTTSLTLVAGEICKANGPRRSEKRRRS